MNFFAYGPVFARGFRVAASDVNGDDKADILTVPGPGGGPETKVFSGLDGLLLMDFFAYSPMFAGGAYGVIGDVNGDA